MILKLELSEITLSNPVESEGGWVSKEERTLEPKERIRLPRQDGVNANVSLSHSLFATFAQTSYFLS